MYYNLDMKFQFSYLLWWFNFELSFKHLCTVVIYAILKEYLESPLGGITQAPSFKLSILHCTTTETHS